MKRWTALGGLLAVALSAPVLAGAAPAPPVPPSADDTTITDPALRQRIAEARSDRRRGESEPTVPVEYLTDDTPTVAASVRSVGGRVVGQVPGTLVQAEVPVERVDDVAATSAVDSARLTRRVNRIEDDLPLRTEAFGSATEVITATGADQWLGVGPTLPGTGVKVGIIDFFDMTTWATLASEVGPVPQPGATMFCRDSIGEGYCLGNQILDRSAHGVAVAEVVKDVAPGAELYIATAATLADTYAAIDWMAARGVKIVTRSLGAAFDGPGDGTGPLADLVDYAASKGIVWFNSAGNDASGNYLRWLVPSSLPNGSYVPFPTGTTWLPITPEGGVQFDGVRWDDWYRSLPQRIDYRAEIWTGVGSPSTFELSDTTNQLAGGAPLELVDLTFTVSPGVQAFLRIRKVNGFVGSGASTFEVGTYRGVLPGAQAAFSAAKPVVDSRNPLLLAVGAVDPPLGSSIGWYSSQGPTNDCRHKPDIAAPSGMYSRVYGTFSGTSAASPAAAGVAAVLVWAGRSGYGADLAWRMRAGTVDLGVPGMDNVFGAGAVRLPAPGGVGTPGTVVAAGAGRVAMRMPLSC